MSTIAIIPARGGSRRLPRKNIADFLGRPLISYTIQSAFLAGCFDRVVVTTEDDEIAMIASDYGAEVDIRRPELATDTVGVVDVCLDLLEKDEQKGRSWQKMVCLYATAALRNSHDIVGTLGLLKPGERNFVMAVTSYTHSPFQAMEVTPDGRLSRIFPDAADSSSRRSQVRVDNGSTYAVGTAAFREHRTFYGPGLVGYDMPLERSIDIDSADDLDRAVANARRLGWQEVKPS
jgi:pseudaminic acid cytidylyltransferase